MPAPIIEVRGTVEATNPTGIKLQSRDTWLNYSKYGYQGPLGATDPKPAPQIGQYVVAQVKNDKFLHAMTIGAVPAGQQNITSSTPIAPPVQVAAAIQQPDVAQDKLIDLKVSTRLDLLRTMAVAQNSLFTLDNGDTLVEIVRNLEQFVLEDMLAMNEPVLDDDVELTDDELDESI